MVCKVEKLALRLIQNVQNVESLQLRGQSIAGGIRNKHMSDIKKLTELVVKFRDERDWKQFHNPKDQAISLALEAAEVLEHFQWKSREEIEEYLRSEKMEDLADELADVLWWVLLMTNDFQIDLANALERKVEKTAKKYPVEKAKGRHTKYTDL